MFPKDSAFSANVETEKYLQELRDKSRQAQTDPVADLKKKHLAEILDDAQEAIAYENYDEAEALIREAREQI